MKPFILILFTVVSIILRTSLFAQPTIMSFTPANGAVGTEVTITGTNFDPTPANNIVYFGAVQATISSANATELVVDVPTGATYMPVAVTVNELTAYSSEPFAVTFSHAEEFGVKQDFTTLGVPYGVAPGDFDGDGKIDLAVANSNNLSILRNDSETPGTVSYETKIDFATGLGPESVVSADFDGDGLLDLAVANANTTSNSISIFRNTSTSGNINFESKVDFATATKPKYVATGDIDGDGKADLVVTNTSSGTISVLRNTSAAGSIAFDVKVDFSTGGAQPQSVAIGDIDGDGNVDIACGNKNGHTVSLFRNTSTSGIIDINSLQSAVTFSITSPLSTAIADIDDDGKPEVIVVNKNGSVVSVFRNIATSGSIDANSLDAKVDFTTGTSPFSVAVGDLDGDTKADLAVANSGGASLSVLRNSSTTGNISFDTKVDYTVSTTPKFVTAADIDGDGKMDLIASNSGASSVSVLRNLSSTDIGTFSFPEQFASPVIDAVNHTVNVTVLGGTDASALVSTFTLPTGATATVGATPQISGTTANDFTGDVIYTITAADGITTQDWTVTVTIPSTETDFTAFSFSEQSSGATIDNVNHTIAIEVVYGTDVSSLISTFTLSDGAAATVGGNTQVKGATANDFSSPVTYTITAEDGVVTQDWTIMVTIADPNTETDFTAFSFSEQFESATINTSNHTIAIEALYGTDLEVLEPTFTLSDGASATVGGIAQVSGTTENNYTSAVIYSVTAEDGTTTQAWTITVTVDEPVFTFSTATLSNGVVTESVYGITVTVEGGSNLGIASSGCWSVNETVSMNGQSGVSVAFSEPVSLSGLRLCGNSDPDITGSNGTNTVININTSGVVATFNSEFVGVTGITINSSHSYLDEIKFTPCDDAPDGPASGMSFDTPLTTSLSLSSWIPAADAEGYVVKINEASSFAAPSNGISPTANTIWQNSGEQVVYNGTSIPGDITVTGLTSSTTYYFKIYAYKNCGSAPIYETVGAVGSETTADKADQTITFEALADKTFGDTDFALTGTASSGLAVAYSSSDTDVATVSGSTVTIVGGGTTTITASQAGDSDYNAATDVTQDLTVNKADQTITFATLADKTFGDTDFDLTGTASSGLAITYSSTDTDVATVSGSTVTIVGVGSTTITASQSGDSNYSAATDVAQVLTVNTAAQTITFAALADKTFGDTDFTLTGTASSGLAVTYSSSDPAVATVSGSTVTIVGGGSTSITASQSGDSDYSAATDVAQVLTVNTAAQTITFAALADNTFGDADFGLTGTASSGLAVTYTSSDPAVATVSGSTVTIVGGGTTTITASQSGDSDYSAATDVAQVLIVNTAAQTITFAALADKTFGDTDFTLTGTASSGLAVTYSSSDTDVATVSGSTVTIVGAGSTTITASQSGDSDYSAATAVTQVLTVNKADQTITFDALADKTFGDADFTLTATASSGLVITYSTSNTDVATVSGSIVTITEAGTTIITASQEGSDNYNSAEDVDQTLFIGTLLGIADPIMTRIYPNPANNQIHIELNNGYVGSIGVKLMEITGRTVKQFSEEKNDQTLNIRVELDNVQLDIFLVEITAGETKQVLRIVRNQ